MRVNELCDMGQNLMQNFQKNVAKKFGGNEKMSTFAIPNEKRGTWDLRFGTEKFIEKTDLLYKKQVPRKNNLSRSVNFFGNYKCQDKLRDLKIYNEEFDPGSGWTLAAGLTHASRGAAWHGDSSKCWWRPAQGCVTREQLARFWGITVGNDD